jgi:predicted acyl esterase
VNSDDLPRSRAYASRVPPSFGREPVRSLYLPMRDGARVAIDVHLPSGAGRVPTLIRQTRYFRAMHARRWASRFIPDVTLDPINARMRDFFVRRGYAWVDVDVRGSGASSGAWATPWSPDEVKDGAQVLDWIVAQPWSNGAVGATGNSYDGTAAELLASNGHPALRAIAPRCSLFDVYTDVAYPGGIRQSWFIRAWTRANQALDANRPEGLIAEALGQRFMTLSEGLPRRGLEAVVRLLVDGIGLADGDRARLELALATRGDNMDVDRFSREVAFRDDTCSTPIGTHTVDLFSPAAHADRVRSSGAALLGISGWFDGAYPHAAIKRHLTLARPGDKLLVGPWNHGCSMHASPAAIDRRPAFDLDAELLFFFDRHLRGRDTGIDNEPRVRFFTMGAERWQGADRWPPPDVALERLQLASGGRLVRSLRPGDAPAATELPVDPAARAGTRSRWRTLLCPLVVPDYRDRKLTCVFESAPLEEDLELTGHALLTLSVRSDADDGALFVYLLERLPGGAERYVTEGELRLLHATVDEDAPRLYRSPAPHRPFTRASSRPFPVEQAAPIAIDLLPVSHRFGRGSRIALALAGADADHFAPVAGARRYAILHPGSTLELPVRRG